MKRAIIIAAIVLIIGVPLLAIIGIQWAFAGQYFVGRYSTRDPETTIELWADNFYDNGRGLCYRVVRSGRVVIPSTAVSFSYEEDFDASEYSVACADTSSLHAVIDSGYVIALYDIRTNQSWPHRDNDEEWSSCQMRGDSLMARFRAENPTLRIADEFR